MSKLVWGLLSAGIVLFTQNPLMATTYEYTGSLYTTVNDELCGGCLGTNLTGTVTLNFDTSSATGTFRDAVFGGNAFTSVTLTSGSLQSQLGVVSLSNFITLTNGSVTAWSLSDLAENQFCNCVLSTVFDGAVGLDSATHQLQTGFPFLVTASTSGSPGVWTAVDLSPIPLPPTLPLFAAAIGIMGLLRWRRSAKG